MLSFQSISFSRRRPTETCSQIVQAVAPVFIGSFSDSYGRRPAILLCMVICVGVNIGLALQNSYAALLVLRCFQSFGSSTTVILSSAVTADLVTRAERGKYMAYSSLGTTLGPALGPLIGGVLVQFLGWRSTFWFLAIWAAVMLVIVMLFLPETSRSVVGNGAIPPQRWNRSIKQMFFDKPRQDDFAETATLAPPKRRPTPIDSFRLSCEKETALLLAASALLFAGYSMVLSSMPSELEDKYGFNALQVGLCYLPYGFGALSSRWTTGSLIDRNFRRHARRHGIEIQRNRQQRMTDFPVEAARLEITIPLVYVACVAVIAYAWVMNFQVHLAGPLIMLFILAHAISGATSTLITLVVDCHVDQPATATAASTFYRFLLGAGAVAIAVPIIERIGIGWTGTIIAFAQVLCSAMLWAVFKWGFKWRQEYRAKLEQKAAEKELRKKEKLGLGGSGLDLVDKK